MEFIWIGLAFGCGYAAKLISLPPSIGFLLAGFVLHGMGYQMNSTVQTLADLGITIMLFTIGLKLNVKELLKREIWLGTSAHTVLWIAASLLVFKTLALIGMVYFNHTWSGAALVCFALGFSSTVCAIKLLEENGELRTRHGRLSVGVLVMQDVIAVIFLVAATGKVPSSYAPLLLLLLPLRPIIFKLFDRIGHGELVPLLGFFAALGAYQLFSVFHIKGDLGALLAGMLLAQHPKASEVSKALLGFKDLFLIGFFMSIGFAALPTLEMIAIAVVLLAAIPFKFALFFVIFAVLRLRVRSAFLAALALSNYSEFGLIVAAISVENEWLTNEWLVILSLAVAFSFVVTNVLYRFAHAWYASLSPRLKRYESPRRLPEDIVHQPDDAEILVVGMGRVGMGAYNALCTHSNMALWGVDPDKAKVNWLRGQGVQACVGDGEDADFWESVNCNRLKLVLLAVPTAQDAENIAQRLKRVGYSGQVAAIARFDDERIAMEKAGIDKVFNFFNEAGVGFAQESLAMIATKHGPEEHHVTHVLERR